MFGYIGINPEALEPAERERYQAFYCGLCRTLKARHGNLSRLTLSFDMTFLLILLSSLYEPQEASGKGRCAPHPLKPRPYTRSALSDYVADMNIALAYHKAQDDWVDEGSRAARTQMRLLSGAYRRVSAAHPEKCARIAGCLREITGIEEQGDTQVDLPANLTAAMLGEIFAYRDDLWQTPLRKMGEELGRFVYVMDAYEDLPGDLKKGRYNPLIPLRGREDFEALCQEGLMMMMSECTQAFEWLPLEQDVAILRNILYGGVWRKYVTIYDQRRKEEPVA